MRDERLSPTTTGSTSEKPADQGSLRDIGHENSEVWPESQAVWPEVEVNEATNKGSTNMVDSDSDRSNPSVFSLAILPSSTMTAGTRLTVYEMQTAIGELVSIFFDDAQIAELSGISILSEDILVQVKAQHSLLEDIPHSSSDEDEGGQPETFTALVSHSRGFILASVAFDNLRKELEKFVVPNGPVQI